MTRLQEKAQGRTKQIIGQMIGDDKLVTEGEVEVEQAGKEEPNHTRRPARQDKNSRRQVRSNLGGTG